jgi:aspartyl-tRNA(Asn)/glutamyl-tRNA(Gln) amidotransferase subunit B
LLSLYLRRENKTIMANTAYETIIGLEVHVQLATESKAFCGDDASFGGEPNTHVSAVSLGHPGTLPKANGRQIELATRLGLALGCKINTHNAFDRKNYFYADLPKGYQITQDKAPICIGGSLSIKIGNNWKSIGIHHIHMEEDAGKSIHTMAPRHSFIDLNRAGVPLVEIVTEPDLRSGEEVDAFMTAMRQLVRYLEVSDGNMEQGSLRCDVNISIREQGATILNDRCEVKNVNSMKFARQAIDYEVRRQIGLVEAGGKVKQQTLNFDPNTGVTSPLREKEDAHDYRYFPEPDLGPIEVSETQRQAWLSELPELPAAKRHRYADQLGLSIYDARVLTDERAMAEYFEAVVAAGADPKGAANWICGDIAAHVNANRLDYASLPLRPEQLAELVGLIEASTISGKIAKEILPELLEQGGSAKAIVAARGLGMISDPAAIGAIVDGLLAAHPAEVEAYRGGKNKLQGFFVGQLMKQTGGRADPKLANQILMEKLKG